MSTPTDAHCSFDGHLNEAYAGIMSDPARIPNRRPRPAPEVARGDELAGRTTPQPGLVILARMIARLHSRAVATEEGFSQEPGEDASKDTAKRQTHGKGTRRGRIRKSNMHTSALARGEDE